MDVHEEDFANDVTRCAGAVAMGEGLEEAAFHLDRGFSDAGGFDTFGCERSESAEGPLVDFGGEVGGGLVHAVGHCAGDEVDDEFSRCFDVSEGVFGFSVGAEHRTDGEGGGIDSADVEIAEWC